MEGKMRVDEFVTEVQRLDNLKADFVAPLAAVSMWQDGEHLEVGTKGAFRLTDIAHGQIASMTKIPKPYYDRCGSLPGLRAENVNAWFHEAEAALARKTIRTQEGRARAILSDRFRPLDNILIAKAALPVLAENPNLEVVAANIGEARMYLQLVFPRLTGEIAVGDPVQYGVVITNSEVGHGSLDVRSILWRLRCRNGMVGESVLRKYHVGRRVGGDDEDYSIFSDETIRAELRSFELRLRDVLRASISSDHFGKLLAKVQGATADRIAPSDMGDVVETVTKYYSFTEADTKRIFDRAMTDGDFSRWGLANAITFQAHEGIAPDRQYDFEVAGYDLASMSGANFLRLVDGKTTRAA